MAQNVLEVVFRGTDESLRRTAQGIGSSFERVGGVIKAGLAIGATAVAGLVVGTGALGVKLIGLGSDAEEMMGKFDVVFANTGEQVTAALSAFGDEVGRSKFELLEMASVFGDTLKPMGFTEEAAATMSVTMSELATDLGSFNNMEMTESMERLQGVLIGNHENALAFGVIINENTLKAELAAQGWDELTGAALEQAKVQARINLLMAGTTDAQGDAARTAGSWANQMRGLKARLTDAATELGIKLLPTLTPLLGMFGDLAEKAIPILNDAFDKLIPFISDIAGFIKGFVTELQNGQGPIDAFIEAILNWTQFGEDNFMMILDTIDVIESQWIPSIIKVKDEVVAFFQPVADWIKNNVELKDVLIGLAVVLGGIVLSSLVSIAAAIGAILLPVFAVIAAVALLREAWESDFLGIRTTITTWAEEHGGIMQGIKDWWADLMITWEQLSVIIGIGADIIKVWWDDLKTTWEQTKFIIGAGIDFVVEKWEWFKGRITSIIGSVKIILDGLGSKFRAIKDGIISALQPIIDLINQVKDALDRLELPEFMQRSSPSPWEQALMGTRAELAALNSRELPALQANLQGFNQSGSTSTSTTDNRQFTMNVNTSNFNPESGGRSMAAFATGGI